MWVVLVLVVGLVLAVTFARRSASHPAVLFLRDFGTSAVLLVRWLFLTVRFVVRVITAEVRSWSTPRS
jgi:anti-sigma-K factor RskA